MSIYEKLFGKNAEESELLINRTKSLVSVGKYKEAEEMLKRAIKMDTSSGKPHRYLGNLYERMQRDQDAEKEYEKAIRLEPDEAEYHNQLATVYFRRNRFREAEKEFRRTIELDPRSEEGHVNLGALLLQIKKYTEAEQELRKAIQINPADGHSHRYLSVVFSDTDRPEEALQELETAIDIYTRGGRINTAQLESVAREMRTKIKERETARLQRESKPVRRHTIEDWNENHSKANQVLSQLFDLYTKRSQTPSDKKRELNAFVNKNHSIIFNTIEFTELLESEIENTVQHGPAIMALSYLEIRWMLTGREDHRIEMEEYTEKVKGMGFKELTDIDL